MTRVHQVPKGTMPAMPPLRQGEVGRRVQGGLPPQPYRSACSKWGVGRAKWNPEPFNSRQIRGEIWADRLAMQ
jgi:hypothetical protein